MTITHKSPWWWGDNDERFNGPFETREIAEGDARTNTDVGFYLCQAEKAPPLKLSQYIDIDQLIEDANQRSWEDFGDPEGDGELFDLKKDQIDDLEKRLKTAADEWQAAHGIVVTPFKFADSTPAEWVQIKGEEKEIG